MPVYRWNVIIVDYFIFTVTPGVQQGIKIYPEQLTTTATSFNVSIHVCILQGCQYMRAYFSGHLH